MSSFIYNIPTKVYFGPNQLCNLGRELSNYGKKVLICYGGGSIKKTGLFDRIVAQIQEAGLEYCEMPGIEPNPRIASVNKGAEICKKEGADVVLAVGGGSVLDCSKFIAAGALYDGDAWDFFTGKAVAEKCLPLVTVLTLAATGSEMDAGGVITNPETNEKLFRIYPPMLPKVSFMDPTETYSVSKFQTASGSADILSHTWENYFIPDECRFYMLDCFKEGLIKTVMKYAPIALEQPDNYEARANLMWASSWAMNGFLGPIRSYAWICHAMEHELSAFYDIAHGLGLAIVTPRWMRYVLDESTVDCFYRYGVNVFELDPTLPKMEVALKSIELTEDFLFNKLGLASTLTEIGIDDSKISIMAKKACGAGGVLPSIKPLKPEDVEKILTACL